MSDGVEIAALGCVECRINHRRRRRPSSTTGRRGSNDHPRPTGPSGRQARGLRPPQSRETPHPAVGGRHPRRHRRAQPGWWYCDADLDDGTGLGVIFATKDGTRPNQPLQPQLEIDLTLPDGTRLVRSWYPKPEEFSASKDGCDVRMGPYRFSGDLHEYRVTGAADELSVDIRRERLTESWRPETSARSTRSRWSTTSSSDPSLIRGRLESQPARSTGHVRQAGV